MTAGGHQTLIPNKDCRMNYDDFAELDLFTEGPPGVVATSMVKLRFDLAKMFPDERYRDALAASLEHVIAHVVQLCKRDKISWDEVVERAEARASLERFFDDENI